MYLFVHFRCTIQSRASNGWWMRKVWHFLLLNFQISIIFIDHEKPKLKSLLFYHKRLLTLSLPILVPSKKIMIIKLPMPPHLNALRWI